MNWRPVILIVAAVLFLGSLGGVLVTYGLLPTEVEQETTLLSYQHRGEFDYLVHQKASYLFGDIPIETPPATPQAPPSTLQYPADITDRFHMSFTYEVILDRGMAVTYSHQMEVRAVMQKPGAEPEEVVLVPATTRTGPSVVATASRCDGLRPSKRSDSGIRGV